MIANNIMKATMWSNKEAKLVIATIMFYIVANLINITCLDRIQIQAQSVDIIPFLHNNQVFNESNVLNKQTYELMKDIYIRNQKDYMSNVENLTIVTAPKIKWRIKSIDIHFNEGLYHFGLKQIQFKDPLVSTIVSQPLKGNALSLKKQEQSLTGNIDVSTFLHDTMFFLYQNNNYSSIVEGIERLIVPRFLIRLTNFIFLLTSSILLCLLFVWILFPKVTIEIKYFLLLTYAIVFLFNLIMMSFQMGILFLLLIRFPTVFLIKSFILCLVEIFVHCYLLYYTYLLLGQNISSKRNQQKSHNEDQSYYHQNTAELLDNKTNLESTWVDSSQTSSVYSDYGPSNPPLETLELRVASGVSLDPFQEPPKVPYSGAIKPPQVEQVESLHIPSSEIQEASQNDNETLNKLKGNDKKKETIFNEEIDN